MTVNYTNKVSYDDYVELIKSAEWKTLSRAQIEKSLAGSAYLSCANIDSKTIGIARLISDNSCHGLLLDVIVLPEHMNKGIGRTLVNNVVSYVKSTLMGDEQFLIELLPSAGKRNFYLKCGFKYKPEKMDGMYLWVKKD